MKKILLFSLLLFACFNVYSQEPVKFKRGYIGISLGPTVHTGTQSGPLMIIPISYGSTSYTIPKTPLLKPGDVGLNINLIDAGYTIGKKWGIALKWQGGAYINELDSEVLMSNFGMIMLGPMYSVGLGNDLFLDLKLRTGTMYSGNTYEDRYGYESESSYFSLGWEGGATLRYNFASRWASINNLEYQNQFSPYNERISRINISSGIAFIF